LVIGHGPIELFPNVIGRGLPARENRQIPHAVTEVRSGLSDVLCPEVVCVLAFYNQRIDAIVHFPIEPNSRLSDVPERDVASCRTSARSGLELGIFEDIAEEERERVSDPALIFRGMRGSGAQFAKAALERARGVGRRRGLSSMA